MAVRMGVDGLKVKTNDTPIRECTNPDCKGMAWTEDLNCPLCGCLTYDVGKMLERKSRDYHRVQLLPNAYLTKVLPFRRLTA